MTTSRGGRARQLHQPTQATLRQLANVVERPAPPEVMARRARALFEIAESLQPRARDPLWTVVGVDRPGTESDYMAFLRVLCERSGLSYQEIASRTAFDASIETVPRSTIHGALKRDRLPRREGQLRALLVVLCNANGGTRADLDSLLALRAELVAARATVGVGEQAVEPAPVASACVRCERRESPWGLARVVSLVMVAVLGVAVLAGVLRFIL